MLLQALRTGWPKEAPFSGDCHFPQLVRAGAVVAANGAALLGAFALGRDPGIGPTLAFIVGILLSSWLGGWPGGLVAVLFSTWAANYLVFSPLVWEVELPQDLLRLGVFSGAALLAGTRHRSQAVPERPEGRRAAAEGARGWTETLLDQGLGPVVLVRPENQELLFANRAARELAGGRYPVVSDTEGADVFFTSMGERLPPAEMPGARAARGESVAPMRLEWHLPEGTLKLMVSARRLAEGPAGEPVVLISYQDLTEAGTAMEALGRSEVLCRTVAESAPVGIFHVDETGRLLYVNAWGGELLGLNEGEELPPEWSAALLGSAATFECRRVDRRGVERWLSVSRAPLLDARQGVSYAVTVYDLTDRKRAEEELRRLSEQRAELVATVSHALRGPIAAMLANLDVIQAAAQQDLAPQHCRLLDHAVRSAMDLSSTVDDLLSLSRLQSGRVRPAEETCALPELVRAVYQRMLPRALSRGIALELAVEPVPPIRSDCRELELLVTELIENAVKYTPTGTRVVLSLREEANQVLLSVRDGGPGIPAEDLPHLFDPFYRGALADQSQVKGSGLGLAIAARAAALLGGKLTAHNHPEGGAEFLLCLPRTPAGEGSGASRRGRGAERAPKLRSDVTKGAPSHLGSKETES